MPYYLGRKASLYLFAAVYYAAYLAVIVMTALRILSPVCLISLTSLIPVQKKYQHIFQGAGKEQHFRNFHKELCNHYGNEYRADFSERSIRIDGRVRGRKMKFFKRSDIIIIICIIAVSAVSWGIYNVIFAEDRVQAEIYYYSDLVETVDLNHGEERVLFHSAE